jgi:L,D-transpeptidase catalytic domain
MQDGWRAHRTYDRGVGIPESQKSSELLNGFRGHNGQIDPNAIVPAGVPSAGPGDAVSLTSRRKFLAKAVAGVAVAAVPTALTWCQESSSPISSAVLQRALAALERHRDSIDYRDVIGIADFSLPSSAPRFHLLKLAEGLVSSHLVAHGRGSDPGHTGWLERFSNEPHSYATSAGAYRTDSVYVGEHGQSIRLDGLDASNSNAASRAIVVHSAWYVSKEIAMDRGVLGRSEGCLAVAQSSLAEVLLTLGPGRLIYADKT